MITALMKRYCSETTDAVDFSWCSIVRLRKAKYLLRIQNEGIS